MDVSTSTVVGVILVSLAIPPWISILAKALGRPLKESRENLHFTWLTAWLAVVLLACGVLTTGTTSVVCGVLGLVLTGISFVGWVTRDMEDGRA